MAGIQAWLAQVRSQPQGQIVDNTPALLYEHIQVMRPMFQGRVETGEAGLLAPLIEPHEEGGMENLRADCVEVLIAQQVLT